MPSAAFADLWKTVQSGKVWTGIVVNKTKSGGYYWVKANVYPSKNGDGSIKYISVRVRPSSQEIEDAIKLYPTL
jgi:aerotaxis receptor